MVKLVAGFRGPGGRRSNRRIGRLSNEQAQFKAHELSTSVFKFYSRRKKFSATEQPERPSRSDAKGLVTVVLYARYDNL